MYLTVGRLNSGRRAERDRRRGRNSPRTGRDSWTFWAAADLFGRTSGVAIRCESQFFFPTADLDESLMCDHTLGFHSLGSSAAPGTIIFCGK